MNAEQSINVSESFSNKVQNPPNAEIIYKTKFEWNQYVKQLG